MLYDSQTEFNPGNCHVVLPDSGLLAAAIAEFQTAPLFDKKIRVEAPDSFTIDLIFTRLIRLERESYASTTQDPAFAKLRESHLTYPTD